MLNVHPSLLPRWRGAAPIERAMMAGRRGDRSRRSCGSPRGSTPGPWRCGRSTADRPAGGLRDAFGAARRARRRAAGRAPSTSLRSGQLEFTEQDDDGATYAEKIAPAERRLDPRAPGARSWSGACARSTPHRRLPGARGMRATRGARRRCPRGAGRTGHDRRRRGRRAVARLAARVLRLEVVQPAGRTGDGRLRLPAWPRSPTGHGGQWLTRSSVAWQNGESTRTASRVRRTKALSAARTAPAAASPGCAPTQLPGRSVCVYCLRRYELVSQCPNCGEHQTIAPDEPHRGHEVPDLRRLDAQLDLMEAATEAPRPSAASSTRASGSRPRSFQRTSRGSARRSMRCMDAGARLIHVDVMDGHFVPPITIGPLVAASIADQVHDAGGAIDVHLMIESPSANRRVRQGRRRLDHLPRRGHPARQPHP